MKQPFEQRRTEEGCQTCGWSWVRVYSDGATLCDRCAGLESPDRRRERDAMQRVQRKITQSVRGR